MSVDPGRTRVLVAENEPLLVDLYEAWLGDEYELSTVHSGEAVLQAMEDRGADVVLLERLLPGLSGSSVVRRLDEEFDTQVIVVTAVSPPLEIADLPIDDYLLKPVERDELRATVQTAALLGTYDDKVAELLGMEARRRVLSQEVARDDLETSEEFCRLTGRIEELQDSLDNVMDELWRRSDVDMFSRVNIGPGGSRSEFSQD